MNTVFIDPGRFRTELALERAEPVSDGAGGHSANWVEVATIFAAIAPQRADSRFAADQTLEEVTHRVTLRARDGVLSGCNSRAGHAASRS